MGMLQRLRDAHPGVTITARDGHYCTISDEDMNIVDHLLVKKDDRTASIDAVEAERRKRPHPKAIESRFDRLIAQFEKAA